MPNERETFAPRCLSLDLEVGVRDRRIRAFAALRPDTGGRLVFRGGNLKAALAKLDALADGAAFLLGHNLIAFDLEHLKAAKPGLRLLRVPAVDTLRLNPLAFPRNPYHHLVKHYQDGRLPRGRLNDPELDARLTLDVFHDQWRALGRVVQKSPDLMAAWHWLTTAEEDKSGFNTFFSSLRGALRPSDAQACQAIGGLLAGIACRTHAREVLADPARQGWALAYVLAWLSVSGGNSVMPPWVRHQFPEAGRLVRGLRDTACADPECGWCRERHDARRELARWFGFDDFRPEPPDPDTGQPMQRSIVEAAMAGRHVLGILPTGAGKSLCYQIPALSRYDKTDALTVVISPLVALMADQVAGLEARGIGSCIAINGLLSLPERSDALDRVRLANADFEPLKLHYQGQVLQIHVMVEYARRGLEAMADALHLAMDYFSLKQGEFLSRWLSDRDKEIERQTTPESWRAIVESLNNRAQQRIVSDDRDQTNVLVLAGPGSGKTRVLVHRIAYLVRVRRENPRGILALAYNRHAAVEIRRRLGDLIGDDARAVTVLTCHGLAMRLTGASFSGRADRPDGGMFQEVVRGAVALLRGEGLPPEESDEQREWLLGGFRWILVDEYQDIDADQYALISALAGRTLEDEDRKLTLFAVGDDDQNIYAFNGASVEFIRRFEADYGPKPYYLTDNYRSTAHIIAAANALIEPARDRMKTGHPIRIDRARAKGPPGGDWLAADSVAQGRVQLLPARRDPIVQARAAMTELLRLAALAPDWDWSRCAVIAREWKYLDPVRALCEVRGIPVQMGNEDIPRFWRLRETRALVDWLREREIRTVDGAELRGWVDAQPPGPWTELLREALDEHALETGGGAEVPVDHFIEWLAEWGRDVRRRQRGLLLLTAHRAKGLEFDHVAVLDGGWERIDEDEDPDAPRRLCYVAMTRARQTLALVRFEGLHSQPDASWPGFVREPPMPAYAGRSHPLLDGLLDGGSVLLRPPGGLLPDAPELVRQYRWPGLDEVNLGFAGRRHRSDRVHRAIAALSPGDPLEVRVDARERWELLNRSATVVGRMSRKFRPPAGTRCVSAAVHAVVIWSRDASEPEFQDGLKCDHWEVVVPELVFEPDV